MSSSATSPSSHGPAAAHSAACSAMAAGPKTVPYVGTGPALQPPPCSFPSRGRRKLPGVFFRWRPGLGALLLVKKSSVERKKCSCHSPSPQPQFSKCRSEMNNQEDQIFTFGKWKKHSQLFSSISFKAVDLCKCISLTTAYNNSHSLNVSTCAFLLGTGPLQWCTTY